MHIYLSFWVIWDTSYSMAIPKKKLYILLSGSRWSSGVRIILFPVFLYSAEDSYTELESQLIFLLVPPTEVCLFQHSKYLGNKIMGLDLKLFFKVFFPPFHFPDLNTITEAKTCTLSQKTEKVSEPVFTLVSFLRGNLIRFLLLLRQSLVIQGAGVKEKICLLLSKCSEARVKPGINFKGC